MAEILPIESWQHGLQEAWRQSSSEELKSRLVVSFLECNNFEVTLPDGQNPGSH
jgi:hypothetical protein